MNRINELKEKLEKLRNAKVDIDNEITEVTKASDVNAIENEIKNLSLEALDIKKGKPTRVLIAICKIVLCSVYISLVALLISIFVQSGLTESALAFGVASLLGGLGLTKIMLDWSNYGFSIKGANQRLSDIQSEIEYRKKKKELAKQNIKLNEQKLVSLYNKQANMRLEIQNLEKKLSKYEAVKKHEIEKFVSSPEFLSSVEAKVFADDMVFEEGEISKGNQKHL